MNLDFQFEELGLIWQGGYRGGLFNGVAEIAALADGDWVVKSIKIDAHNGKCGPSADSKQIELSRTQDAALFEMLCESLRRFSGAYIDDAIEAMKAEAA